jgi:hypothetical protein
VELEVEENRSAGGVVIGRPCGEPPHGARRLVGSPCDCLAREVPADRADGRARLLALDFCGAARAACRCCSLRIRHARVGTGRMAKATAEPKVAICQRPPPGANPTANPLDGLTQRTSRKGTSLGYSGGRS